MLCKFVLILFFLATSATCASASKILVIFPWASRSHYILGNKLAKTLAARGHEVTLISAYEDKSLPKNLQQVIISGQDMDNEEHIKNIINRVTKVTNPVAIAFFMGQMGLNMTRATLSHPAMQKLLNDPSQEFDAVIVEKFMNSPLDALSHHYNAPLIAFSPVGPMMWVNELVGNPEPYSYIPNAMAKNTKASMNFWDRLYNVFVGWIQIIHINLFFYKEAEAIKLEFFPEAPHIYDISHNVSLVLLNSHISTHKPVPVLPNMVEIGGYHVDPPKKLPEDLEKYLNSSKNGVVYFSLGSNMQSKFLPEEIKDAILKTFAKLTYDVLWKFEADDLPGKPSNVRIEKWLPQQDILAHPKVILFITHGGLLSTIETIYHGKQIVGIPLFGDQQTNMANAVANGFGLKLDYSDLTEESLTALLDEALNNPRYAENAKKRSELMHDRLASPRDTLVYWVEYVIRHKGSKHFRSAALDLYWYQLYSLDVIGFVLAVIVGFIYFVRSLFRKLCSSSNLRKTKKD